jgi:hypothetical protein
MTAKTCPQCRGDLDPRALVTIEAFLKVHSPDQYEEARQEITEEEIVNLQELAKLLSSTKIDKMLEILQNIKEETGGKDKTICFSQFTSFVCIYAIIHHVQCTNVIDTHLAEFGRGASQTKWSQVFAI